MKNETCNNLLLKTDKKEYKNDGNGGMLEISILKCPNCSAIYKINTLDLSQPIVRKCSEAV